MRTPILVYMYQYGVFEPFRNIHNVAWIEVSTAATAMAVVAVEAFKDIEDGR